MFKRKIKRLLMISKTSKIVSNPPPERTASADWYTVFQTPGKTGSPGHEVPGSGQKSRLPILFFHIVKVYHRGHCRLI